MSVEELLSAGTDVKLARRDAYEVLQKLRARGGESETAARLESRMAESDAEEIALESDEARQLLEALKASGRRWISGTDAPRPEPPRKAEPEPEPKRRWFWRKG